MYIITRVLDVEEIKELADCDGYITVILPVPVDFLIHNTFTDFLNFISNSILGYPALLDIKYRIEGSLNTNILFSIYGNVSVFLEYMQNANEF